ncbi:hypothetical protein ACLESD_11320 [Pyxidicoccus sp. 3LFB2]
MAHSSPLSPRLGFVAAQATFVQAALLAAHGAGARAGGFRASDVRFFFLLFTNWAEHDVTRPSQDIDLTQVRRTLTRLRRSGWVEAVPGAARDAGPRGSRHVLTGEGLAGLSEGLASGERPPLEEALFTVVFAASYRGAVLSRVEGRTRSVPAAVRRRVERALDPLRLLAAARKTATSVLADLEERVQSGLLMHEQAREGLARGLAPEDLVRQVEARGSYQLHRVKPLGELLLALPEDLRDFELQQGMALRAHLLFEPLAERARAEVALLERLERKLTAQGSRLLPDKS